MIRNYFKVALRNMRKHAFFTAINLFGLTSGMICCLFIFIYVVDEVSYDKFHHDVQKIYRLGLHGKMGEQEIFTSVSSAPVGLAMKTEIPGVEDFTRVWQRGDLVFKNGDLAFTEKKVFYADSNFFQFFSFVLKEGDARTALKEPHSIVITPALAGKYFGKENPVGKTLTLGNDNAAFKVTGIAEPAPSNSHFHYGALLSFSTVDKEVGPSWLNNSMWTYIRKNPATLPGSVESKLNSLVEKNVGPELEKAMGIDFKGFIKRGGVYGHFIYPLTDSHLYSTLRDNPEPNGDIRYVYAFSFIGLFILCIACINFMNLSTAQSAGRAKEVGLRKTLGSQRGQMILQFMGESLWYSLAAMILAVLIAYLLLPSFNLLSGKELSLSAIFSPLFLTAIIILTLFVGMLAGSYPAFYLTAFSAITVLRGKMRTGIKSKGVRSTLVVVQFAISIFLIMATAVVYQQLSFLQTRNLGMDRNHMLILQNMDRLGNGKNAFKTEISKLSGVEKASFCDNYFPGINNTTIFRAKGSDKDHIICTYFADEEHQDVMRFSMAAGRNFSKEFPSDSNAVLINEAAAKEFGWSDPLREEVIHFGGPTAQSKKIVGVFKDFSFESVKTKVRPLIIQWTSNADNLMIRYSGDSRRIIEAVGNVWKQEAKGEPFEYAFMDQNYDSLFRAEQRLRNIFLVFSGLAILIACLGLFALAAYTTEQRTKEIGIRKALGATVENLTLVLSREFTILVIVAFVPAALAGWYFMSSWLSEFEYHIGISLWLFVGSGFAAVLLAWLTVSFQSIKAARSNPVKALRYE
jgi:putative ABC transport system permease protein